METIEALVIGGLCGLASTVLIGNNYYRIFNYYRKNPKKVTGSPVYLLGGILGVIAVLSLLGSDFKSKWYYCLIPIVLDWGLFVVALLFSIFAPPRKEDIVENESEEEQSKYDESKNDGRN